VKPFAKKFYASKEWKKCRQSYIISVHGICERCGNAGKIVHHKILLTPNNINDPSITLNHEHLEYVCHPCHNQEHMGGTVAAKGLVFDEEGNLIKNNFF
jgi:5-methylcytosine-specific restriction enzyme A